MSMELQQEAELHAALLVMSYEAQDKRDKSIQQQVHKTDMPKS